MDPIHTQGKDIRGIEGLQGMVQGGGEEEKEEEGKNVNAYLLKRQAKIQRNQEKLQQLGLIPPSNTIIRTVPKSFTNKTDPISSTTTTSSTSTASNSFNLVQSALLSSTPCSPPASPIKKSFHLLSSSRRSNNYDRQEKGLLLLQDIVSLSSNDNDDIDSNNDDDNHYGDKVVHCHANNTTTTNHLQHHHHQQKQWMELPRWSPKSNMNNNHRKRFASAVCNGIIYIFGGTNDKNCMIHTVEWYDLKTNLWTNVSSTTSTNIMGRSGCSASTVGNKIYIFGGQVSHVKNPTKKFEIFDTVTKKWCSTSNEQKDERRNTTTTHSENNNNSNNNKISMMFSRDLHASVAIGKKIYVFGGRKLNGRGECYDTETKKWVEMGRMIEPRSSFGAVAVGNKIYAIGGIKPKQDKCDQSNSNRTSQYSRYLQTMEIYDTTSNEWTLSNEIMKNRRSGCCAVKIGSTITVMGGLAAMKDGKIQYVRAIEAFHIRKGKWSGSYIPPSNDERAYFCSHVLKERELIVIGGMNERNYLEQVESCQIPDIVSKFDIPNNVASNSSDYGIPPVNLLSNIVTIKSSRSTKHQIHLQLQSNRRRKRKRSTKRSKSSEKPKRSRRLEQVQKDQLNKNLANFKFKFEKIAKVFENGQVYYGKIIDYNKRKNWWRVEYDDGDSEDLEREEVVKGKKLYNKVKKIESPTKTITRSKRSNQTNRKVFSEKKNVSTCIETKTTWRTTRSNQIKRKALVTKINPCSVPTMTKSSIFGNKLQSLAAKVKAKLEETKKKEEEMIGESQSGPLKDRLEQLQHIDELVSMEESLFGSTQAGTFEERMGKIEDFMEDI